MPYKIKARTRKPVYRKPAQRKKVTTVKAVKKIVNKVINKKIETKKLDLNLGLVNINHNNFSAVPGNKVQVILNNPGVNMPIQGDAQFNCDGLKYNIIGCHLYCMFQIAADRMNTKFRVLVVRASASKTFSAYDDLFDNITGNITLDPPDREANFAHKDYKVTSLLLVFTLAKRVEGVKSLLKEIVKFAKKI